MGINNPLALSKSTRFAPIPPRTHSRSPSRSPVRKSQFLAKELDPLLSNLSPDSTLKALQATSTIVQGAPGQDALTKSIADVSPTEREIGIRAAVAAQKLKQWRQEVESWTWPGRRDRARGSGFLLPRKNSSIGTTANTAYLGCLPRDSAEEYEDRIEDIRDGIEALELEAIKDHIFSAHIPRKPVPQRDMLQHVHQPSYGRMRDFTALVTATVVQALPDMANLNTLLDTWDIRLSVLRQIPNIENAFKSTRAGVETARSVIRDPSTGPLVTLEEFDMTKKLLGDKVALLGSKIDSLLDALEGQEDTLPQEWMDSLEDIENNWAEWVVEAERIAIKNDVLSKSTVAPPQGDDTTAEDHQISDLATKQAKNPTLKLTDDLGNHEPTIAEVGTPVAELPDSNIYNTFPFLKNDPEEAGSTHKPSLSVKTGHRRGASEISTAGSAFSGISDFSEPEIVDARRTRVVSSPKISLIDNPFRSSRDELSWFTPNPDVKSENGRKPPLLQRASTASIEIIPKEQVKHVTLNKSQSHDMLGSIAQSPPSTPSKALRQLSGLDSRDNSPAREENAILDPFVEEPSSVPMKTQQPVLSQLQQPMVDPLNLDVEDRDIYPSASPSLPRRSSKRVSQLQPAEAVALSSSPIIDEDDEHFSDAVETLPDQNTSQPMATSPRKKPTQVTETESLEDKIKDILTTMPTRIRLASDSDSDQANRTMVASASRSSTPGPALMLSPVKAERSNRKVAPGDVREFHLTRTDQSRDAPPVKLFVRAVGEHGERVMVRVGGGWADLGEYLREYSSHHGHRGLSEGKLEVVNFPGSQNAKEATIPSMSRSPSPPDLTPNVVPDGNKPAKRRSFSSSTFGFAGLSNLNIGKSRKTARSNSIDPAKLETTNMPFPPPVPAIPATYTTRSPIASTTTQNGRSTTAMIPNFSQTNPNQFRAVSTPVHLATTVDETSRSPTVNTSMSTNNGNSYKPLGAAGPKSQGRRVVSAHAGHGPGNEAWVEGMVGKARAVSNNTTSFQSPIVTTTTTTTFKSTPAGRRVSTQTNVTPQSRPSTASPSISTATGSPQAPGSVNSSSSLRPTKSRLSLGDVSGIRRVFLRRKSSKQ